MTERSNNKGYSRYQSGGVKKGGMNDAKALLDSLMGPSRNVSAKEKTGDDFKKKEVCKPHLVGYCTGDWFQNTRARQSLGWRDGQHMPCTKIHSDQLKADFESHPKTKKYRALYVREFMKQLERLAHDADARVSRESAKCRPPGKEIRIPELLKPKYEEQEKLYSELMKLVEETGNSGKVAESEATMRKADEIKKWLDEMRTMHTQDFPGEEVCEVCGARFQKEGAQVEGQSRAVVFEHYDGKIHKGFAQIRTDIEDIKKEISNSQDFSPPSDDEKPSRGSKRDRSRDRKPDANEYKRRKVDPDDDFAFIFEGRR